MIPRYPFPIGAPMLFCCGVVAFCCCGGLLFWARARSSRGRTTTSAGFGQGPKLGLVGSRHSGRSVCVATNDGVIRRRWPIDGYENRRAAALSAKSGHGHVQRPTLTSITHCGTTAQTAVKLTRPTADGLVQCTKQRRHHSAGVCSAVLIADAIHQTANS